jgi:hypothetical protein
MLPALNHVLDLVKKHSDGRRTNLVLITDAQIGNEAGVLEAMRAMPAVPVHCFGIDITLNDSLLLELTRQQGGTFHSLHPSDDIRAAVTALGRTLRQPVLLNLLPAEGWELATARIPDLYAGQVCYVSARSHNGEVPPALHGKDAQGKPVSIGFAAEEVGNLAGYLHWCKGRIQDLIVQGKQKEAIALLWPGTRKKKSLWPSTNWFNPPWQIRRCLGSHAHRRPATASLNQQPTRT